MSRKTMSVSISGSGGSGAVTVGLVLLKSIASAGFYGYLSRFSGPQIRGGESSILLNFSDSPIETSPEVSDIHYALDWNGFERFSDEIPLGKESCIIYDSTKSKLPDILSELSANIIEVNVHEAVKKLKGSRPNAFAIGIIASKMGLSLDAVFQALHQVLDKKGVETLTQTIEAVKRGYALLEVEDAPLKFWEPTVQKRWNISGNEACGLGALRAGIKFAAAYPITPASDIVEYLASRLEKSGGTVFIAEDELAAINMIIGASFGGKASMTATSGPGFSLMVEGMGLAIASEIPVVVVNVMRGGPSTGIPTKSEQTDLNQVLFAMHGEAPHVVVAPLHIADNVLTTQWAVGLAEALQTLVVVLSDQRLGQSRAIIDAVPSKTYDLKRKLWTDSDTSEEYERYAMAEDNVSAMAIPGMPHGQYAADGLEHTVKGTPSSMASDHQQQLKKREDKIKYFKYGEDWAEIVKSSQKSRAIVLTWGSTFANVKEAVSLLNTQGVFVDILALRLLMPLCVNAIVKFCKDKKVIVVEQSYSGQFYHYCLGQDAIDSSALLLAKPGPLVLKSGEIKKFIEKALS
jgi:2-oxoglutarate ferredoxin oxidoreductase subunit alpha